MPRRPGGGTPPPGSVEAGIRDLALNTGPDVGKLIRGDTEGILTLMALARPPQDFSDPAKASAVLRLLHSLLPEIGNPRWRAAAKAALRIPPDQYTSSNHGSLAGRMRAAAERNDDGDAGSHLRSEEDYRGYWISAANRLATMLEDRVKHLNSVPELWRDHASRQTAQPALDNDSRFERIDILYLFRGDRGHQSINYRWFVPEGKVTYYDALGWYFSDPDAPVEIVPIANCSAADEYYPAPSGGRRRRLYFSDVVSPGEVYFFAYAVYFNSSRPCRPAVQQEVLRPRQEITFRIQFDTQLIPRDCWSFGGRADVGSWQLPARDSLSRLKVSSGGYVEHVFSECEVGCKYGIRWVWPGDESS